MFAVSEAKSVSTMRLRDADRFSFVDCRFLIVESKRDCSAPSSARWPLTLDRAASATLIAACAPSKVLTSMSATDFRLDEAAVAKPLVSLTEKPCDESSVMVPLASAPVLSTAVVPLAAPAAS
jgi:hypothetical protein